MESQYLIYGLIDPRTHFIRYIGQSSRGLNRPKMHRYKPATDQTHCARWVRSLQRLHLEYEVTVLEMCTAESLDDAERWWIAYGRCTGWPLTNWLDGGEGASCGDKNPMANPVYRQKVSAAHRGRKHSPEARRRMSAGSKGKGLGRRHTEEALENMRVAQRAWRESTTVSESTRAKLRSYRATPETKVKISEAATRRWTTPEMIEFMKGPNNPARKPGVREKIRAAAKSRVRPRQPCGTISAYSYAIKQRKLGLPNCGPCAACKRASADYAMERKKRKAKQENDGD